MKKKKTENCMVCDIWILFLIFNNWDLPRWCCNFLACCLHVDIWNSNCYWSYQPPGHVGGGISLEVASKQIYDIFKVLVNISVFTNMKAIAPLDPPM